MASTKRRVSPMRQRGLSLIELMVVVAVIAILGTIVLPTYERYITAVRRADGRAAITDVALAQERYISVYQTYTDDFNELKTRAALDNEIRLVGSTYYSPKQHYSLAVTASTTAFTITGTRQPSGADDECTSMTLTSAGVKTGTGTKPEKCW